MQNWLTTFTLLIVSLAIGTSACHLSRSRSKGKFVNGEAAKKKQTEAETKLKSLSTSNKDLKAKYKTSQDSLKKEVQKHAGANQKITALEETIRTKKQLMTTLQATVNQVKIERDRFHNQLKNRSETTPADESAELTTLRTKLAAEVQKVNTLTGGNATLNNELTQLDKRFKKLKGQIKIAKKNKKDQAAAGSADNKEYSSIVKELADVVKSRDALKGKLRAKKKLLTSTQNLVDQQKTKIKNLESSQTTTPANPNTPWARLSQVKNIPKEIASLKSDLAKNVDLLTKQYVSQLDLNQQKPENTESTKDKFQQWKIKFTEGEIQVGKLHSEINYGLRDIFILQSLLDETKMTLSFAKITGLDIITAKLDAQKKDYEQQLVTLKAKLKKTTAGSEPTSGDTYSAAQYNALKLQISEINKKLVACDATTATALTNAEQNVVDLTIPSNDDVNKKFTLIVQLADNFIKIKTAEEGKVITENVRQIEEAFLIISGLQTSNYQVKNLAKSINAINSLDTANTEPDASDDTATALPEDWKIQVHNNLIWLLGLKVKIGLQLERMIKHCNDTETLDCGEIAAQVRKVYLYDLTELADWSTGFGGCNTKSIDQCGTDLALILEIPAVGEAGSMTQAIHLVLDSIDLHEETSGNIFHLDAPSADTSDNNMRLAFGIAPGEVATSLLSSYPTPDSAGPSAKIAETSNTLQDLFEISKINKGLLTIVTPLDSLTSKGELHSKYLMISIRAPLAYIIGVLNQSQLGRRKQANIHFVFGPSADAKTMAKVIIDNEEMFAKILAPIKEQTELRLFVEFAADPKDNRPKEFYAIIDDISKIQENPDFTKSWTPRSLSNRYRNYPTTESQYLKLKESKDKKKPGELDVHNFLIYFTSAKPYTAEVAVELDSADQNESNSTANLKPFEIPNFRVLPIVIIPSPENVVNEKEVQEQQAIANPDDLKDEE